MGDGRRRIGLFRLPFDLGSLKWRWDNTEFFALCDSQLIPGQTRDLREFPSSSAQFLPGLSSKDWTSVGLGVVRAAAHCKATTWAVTNLHHGGALVSMLTAFHPPPFG